MPLERNRLVELVRQAGQEVIRANNHHCGAHLKADGSVVTAVDIEVYHYLAAKLRQETPDIPLLCEEQEGDHQQAIIDLAAGGLWILDPLDGTTNFANGYPAYCISLGYVANGETQLAAIYDPVRDECFSAKRGEGAWLNEVRIKPYARSENLNDCTAMIDLKRLPAELWVRLHRSGWAGSQRNLGTSALEWCWLAAGRFQLYLHGGQKLWDYAGGRLIVSEAGAVFTQYDKKTFIPTEFSLTLAPQLVIAAADDSLLQKWKQLLQFPWKLE